MKKIIVVLMIIVVNITYSQKIEFLERYDTLENTKEKLFVFLCPETDLTNSKLVAKVKATGNINDVFLLFQTIKNEVQKIGSNSFKLEKFTKVGDENAELIVSTYFCKDSVFENNYKNIPKNKIYIFGDQNIRAKNTQNFKINREEHEIESGKFKEFNLKIGEQLKINKGGGRTGKTYWINGEEDKIATFFSFTGIGLIESTHKLETEMGIINIKSDQFNIIDPNFGLMLLKIFDPQK
ncbi:MAG: hypothetical protein RL542_1521 [Bacteroidota bacterium]|jgi:hypothetical protein